MSSPLLVNKQFYLNQICMLGNIEKVKELIKEGIDINPPYTYNEKSPLYWAASQNRVQLVDYLLTTSDIATHPEAKFHQEDILSLFRCERVEVLEYLILNHYLVYDNTIFQPLKDTLETMAYSQEENVDKLDCLLSYMKSYLEKNQIEHSLKSSSIKTSKLKL